MKEWKHPDKFPRSDFRSARRPSNSAATSFFSLCPRWAGVSVGRHCPRTVFPIFPRFLLVVLHSVFPSPLRHEAFGIHSPVVTSFGGGAGATPRFKRADPGPSRGTQPRCVAFRTHLLFCCSSRPGLGARGGARAREASRQQQRKAAKMPHNKRGRDRGTAPSGTGTPTRSTHHHHVGPTAPVLDVPDRQQGETRGGGTGRRPGGRRKRPRRSVQVPVAEGPSVRSSGVHGRYFATDGPWSGPERGPAVGGAPNRQDARRFNMY